MKVRARSLCRKYWQGKEMVRCETTRGKLNLNGA